MPQSYSIFIIGANRGIGFELATRLLEKGHKVYGSYRAQSRDNSAVVELQRRGMKTVEVDFTDEASIIDASKMFEDQPLDILINSAGIYHMWDDKPFTELSADDLLDHFKVNTLGPFLTSKYLAPHLARSTQGKIINISSDMASIADNTGGNACYRISKCALNQLTKNMAVDFGQIAPNVITLAVHPGYVPTKMTGYVGDDDMETCMTSLVNIVEVFGTPGAPVSLSNGGYVRWNGDKMDY
ncbi:hypothetical protein CVT25_009197 [Psilocybe cyanescens]|uniref:Uncharacterized protein n=1 Tax=Psilocybe cyanescens TaxID=93625 RepID=A0A409WWH4_PSICY|nr:hypothetical protein CVT25_009197 [Psilocybe cyanescens]